MSTADDTPVLHLPRPQTGQDVLSDGERYVKEISRHKWVGAFLATILGAGGAVGGSIAAANMSEVNQVEVQNLKEATKSLEPRVKKTESDIQSIKTSVGGLVTSNKAIAGGIEELKQVNVKRLEKELVAKEKELAVKDRELQRLRNRDR